MIVPTALKIASSTVTVRTTPTHTHMDACPVCNATSRRRRRQQHQSLTFYWSDGFSEPADRMRRPRRPPHTVGERVSLFRSTSTVNAIYAFFVPCRVHMLEYNGRLCAPLCVYLQCKATTAKRMAVRVCEKHFAFCIRMHILYIYINKYSFQLINVHPRPFSVGICVVLIYLKLNGLIPNSCIPVLSQVGRYGGCKREKERNTEIDKYTACNMCSVCAYTTVFRLHSAISDDTIAHHLSPTCQHASSSLYTGVDDDQVYRVFGDAAAQLNQSEKRLLKLVCVCACMLCECVNYLRSKKAERARALIDFFSHKRAVAKPVANVCCQAIKPTEIPIISIIQSPSI